MFLIGDILLFPIHGVLWLGRKIHDAAQDEIDNEAEALTVQLSELYMMLETGKISEEEFAAEEKILLERLDRIHQRGRGPEAEDVSERKRDNSDQRRAA